MGSSIFNDGTALVRSPSDFPNDTKNTLDIERYNKFVKDGDFKDDFQKLNDEVSVERVVGRRRGKLKRRIRFYSKIRKNTHDIDHVELFMPVWVFFKTIPFSLRSPGDDNGAQDKPMPFSVDVRRGTKTERHEAEWQFDGSSCLISAKYFNINFSYEPEENKFELSFRENIIYDKDNKSPSGPEEEVKKRRPIRPRHSWPDPSKAADASENRRDTVISARSDFEFAQEVSDYCQSSELSRKEVFRRALMEFMQRNPV